MSDTTQTKSGSGGIRIAVQKFGTFLSGMIMPNIPALIAWGLITAFFIPVGWTPNEGLATLVDPTIHYLLPLIIANTGGRMVYEMRGGVVGTVATIGAIAGSDYLIDQFNAAALAENPDAGSLGYVHMFIGAMILGPLGAWVMKKLDALWEGKIKAGFEMLVNMFSAGIAGFFLMIFGFYVIARLVNALMDVLGSAVGWLIDTGFLPLVSLIIEPAKIFFLNNAINHGVLTPLGTTEAASTGKSILFLLEANPGPGLGILLAFSFFGVGMAKASAPGAAIIHFFGGIHEIYFPYVLMKPALILAAIGGGMTGVATNMVFHTGLRAPAAPGSFIAIMLQTANDSYLGVILSVLLSTVVSFLIAAVILRASRKKDLENENAGDLSAAIAKTEANKGKKSSVLSGDDAPVTGMGSSAMGASVVREKVKKAGFGQVTVINKAVRDLDDTPDIVVTQRELSDQARKNSPNAVVVAVDNFMNSLRYDEVVEMVAASYEFEGVPRPVEPIPQPEEEPEGASEQVLSIESIVLSGSATSYSDAIDEAGSLLVKAGGVDNEYVAAMHKREELVTTYMGNFLAIPHGTNEAKDSIKRSAISFVRYPDGIDWKGKPVKFVVGIAGVNNSHMSILRRIALTFSNNEKVARLEAATTAQEVLDILEEK